MRRRFVIFGAAALLGVAAAFAPIPGGQSEKNASSEATALVEDAARLAKAGDVLFKSDGGLWGRLADSFSRSHPGFGHVGLVAIGADGALSVIHAGGDPISREGRVQETPLEAFLARATIAALYRPSLSADEAATSLAFARAAARRAAPFDSDFSLATEDRLYCTELVWRALSAALGRDAIPEKSKRQGLVYVALDDLAASPSLSRVWRSQAANAPQGSGRNQSAPEGR
jgi:hypothetical protein